MTNSKQLIIALVVGAAALFGNKTYLDSRVSELSPKEFVSVVRAKTRLRAGTRITTALLEQAKIPKNYAPLASVKWADRESLVGEEVSVDVLKGDYLLSSYFVAAGTVGRTLSQQLAGDNARAITLPVDEINSLSTSIVAGDRVDILITFNLPVVNQKISTTLLQNVLVLSTGRYSQTEQELGGMSGRPKRYNSITLKLSAEDAMRLTYAEQIGKTHIMLRGQTDDAITQIAPVGTVADLLSPADRDAVAQLAQRLQASRTGEDESLQRQLAAVLELQRRQSVENQQNNKAK